MEEEITFKSIVKCIINRIYILIIFTILGFLIGFLYNNSKDVYVVHDVSASMYLNVTSTDKDDSSTILIANEKKVQTYAELIKSKIVIDKVISNLNLNLSYSDILGKISVAISPGTSIINIIYTDSDSNKAIEFVKELCSVFINDELDLGIENIILINDGNITDRTISYKNLRYIVSMTALGFVTGVVVSYGADIYLKNKKAKKAN